MAVATKSKPERFSQGQELLRDCIKYFIKFYYAIDPSKPKEEWPWDPIYKAINKIAEFYGHKGETNYDKDTGKLIIKDYRPSANANIPENVISYECKVKNDHIKKIASIMNDLIAEIQQKAFVHLEFVGVTDQLKTELITSDNMSEFEPKDDDESKQISSSPHKMNVMQKGISLMDNAIIEAIRKHSLYKHVEKDIYRADVSHQRFFRVKPTTQFGNKLLNTKNYGAVRIIYPLASPKVRNFYMVLYYILIHFHIVFYGVERLKICRWEKCKKIFFEEKRGAGKYCPKGPCRKASYADSNKNDPKKKCRDRQNNWASNRGLHNLQKSHCKPCEIYLKKQKGGSCPKLREENDEKEFEKALQKKPRILH